MSIFSMFNLAHKNPNPDPGSEVVPLLVVTLIVAFGAWITYMQGRRFIVNGKVPVCAKCRKERLQLRQPGQLCIIKRDKDFDGSQCKDCGRR